MGWGTRLVLEGERRTSRASKVKRRAAHEAAWSERGASRGRWAEALTQIGADLGLIHAGFTRKERNANSSTDVERIRVYARAADVRLLFQSTFEYIGRKGGKFPQQTVRECTITIEKFRSAFGFFFLWIFLVIHGAKVVRSPVPIEEPPLRFRITRTRAHKGGRCVLPRVAYVADYYDCMRLSARIFISHRSIVLRVKLTPLVRAAVCSWNPKLRNLRTSNRNEFRLWEPVAVYKLISYLPRKMIDPYE